MQSATGSVSVKGAAADGTALVASTGARLKAPFIVQTGADGGLTLTHDEDTLTIRPNTVTSVPTATATHSGITTRIRQSLGAVFYQVQHRVQDRFEVETPYLVSVVKGTTFNIHVTDLSTTVVLIEGRLLVHTPDMKSQVMLEPGQSATHTRQSEGILLKNQKTLSVPDTGPISVAIEGAPSLPVPVVGTLLSNLDLGGYTALNISPDLGSVDLGASLTGALGIVDTGTAGSSVGAHAGLTTGGAGLSTSLGGGASIGGGGASIGGGGASIGVGASIGGGASVGVGASIGLGTPIINTPPVINLTPLLPLF
ncbi:MAG TPA: FecR domain-containing protein [Thiobacillus sp.]